MININKTESIRTKIFKAILHGSYSPGDKLPAEREMAELTKSSRVTVRRAYQQLEQSNILQRIHGKGTFVTNHTSGNKQKCQQIALLTAISDNFALEFIKEIEASLTALDILLILRITDDIPDKEELAAIDLVGKGINNLIIWPSGNSFVEETFKRLRVLGTNMVFFDRIIPANFADYIGIDNQDAINQLFLHADKNSIKTPIFITYRDLVVDSNTIRVKAFQQNCLARNLNPKIIKVSRTETITELPKELTKNSTLFFVNDELAQKFKPFLHNQNIYSIDGFIDFAVSYKQPIKKMAETVVNMLLKQQEKGENWSATKQFFKGELINV